MQDFAQILTRRQWRAELHPWPKSTCLNPCDLSADLLPAVRVQQVQGLLGERELRDPSPAVQAARFGAPAAKLTVASSQPLRWLQGLEARPPAAAGEESGAAAESHA